MQASPILPVRPSARRGGEDAPTLAIVSCILMSMQMQSVIIPHGLPVPPRRLHKALPP